MANLPPECGDYRADDTAGTGLATATWFSAVCGGTPKCKWTPDWGTFMSLT